MTSRTKPTSGSSKRRVGRHLLVLDKATSARLGRIRQADTSPERAVRSALHSAGLRFRKSNRDLPGSPDIANRRARWAVFVHGCFWHQHKGCPRATSPKRNAAFWLEKFRANRERDRRVQRALRGMGYVVATFWECEADDTALLRMRTRALLDLLQHRS